MAPTHVHLRRHVSVLFGTLYSLALTPFPGLGPGLELLLISKTYQLTNVILFVGPPDHLDRHPSNHQRIQLGRRHRLVRDGVLAHQLRVPARVWQTVHRIQYQGHVHDIDSFVRSGFGSLRCSPKLDCFHTRTGHCGFRFWRHTFRYCTY